MAVGTKDLAPEQLRGLDDARLADELKKAKEELFNLRFQSATGQLDNHGRLRAVKKDIARIYTEMRERELGIGSAPAAPKADECRLAAEDPAGRHYVRRHKAQLAQRVRISCIRQQGTAGLSFGRDALTPRAGTA